MRRRLLSLHRWLGLCSGILLLLVGLSGSALVYRKSLERWLSPALYTIAQTGPRLSLDSLYDIVYTRSGGNFTSCSFDMPSTQEEVIEFTLSFPARNHHSGSRYIVDLDPYTGRVLREGYCDDPSISLTHWLMYFHDSFHFGQVGLLVVAVAAMIMFLSIITGLFIHGKNIINVMTFRIPLMRQRGTHLYRAIHVYVGVWTLLFTIPVFFTGFWMVRSALSPSGWKLDEPRKAIHITASLDSCLMTSGKLLSGFIPDYVSIPARESDPIRIDGNMAGSSKLMLGDASFVSFHAMTGNAVGTLDIRTIPFPENLVATFWPLHAGNYGGNGIRMVYVVGGLMPGVLAISGFILWWKRRTVAD